MSPLILLIKRGVDCSKKKGLAKDGNKEIKATPPPKRAVRPAITKIKSNKNKAKSVGTPKQRNRIINPTFNNTPKNCTKPSMKR